MKKTILSIALVLAGLMGTSAMAQTPVTTATQTTQSATAPTDKTKARPNPFEGLNLSEKQQAEIKALREGCKAERQKIAEKEKAEKKEMKEQRAKDAKEYLVKIKDILSPEQYVQFLENAYLNNQGVFGKRAGKQGMRAGNNGNQAKNGKQANRSDRKGQKGQRAQRQQQAAAAQTSQS